MNCHRLLLSRVVRIPLQKTENSAHHLHEFCANSAHFSSGFFHFKIASRIAVLCATLLVYLLSFLLIVYFVLRAFLFFFTF